jgi:hypothetical protein
LFSSTNADPVLVQLYNYTQGEPVSFQVGLTGVTASRPAASTAPAAAPASTTVASAIGSGTANNPIELKETASASLPGSVAGSYRFYSLPYAGDGSTPTVTLNFAPGSPDVASAVFVNVYQNGTLLTSAQGSSASIPGQLVVGYTSTTAGLVLIQVANYNAGATISYSLVP